MVTYHETGFGTTTGVSSAGNPTDPGGVFGSFSAANLAAAPDFALIVTGASGIQSSSLTMETSAAVDITNTSGAAHTLTLVFTVTNFSSPTAPPTVNMLSHVGGSVPVGGAANLLSFVSQAGGTSDVGLTPSITATGSYQADSTTPVATLTAPFSIVETLTITLDAGASINFGGSTTLQATPVPAPAGLALLLSGLPVLGLRGLLRRRKKA
jgi:hypothetical protein